MIKNAFAKINLSLDILGKDETGYHNVQTILQEISLNDEILIEKNKNHEIEFKGEESHLIDPENNTITEAIKAMKPKNKYKIIVTKNIPLGAGLGGGSSNAATIIKAVNEIEKMQLGSDEMREITKNIGVDVPFFIDGGTALGTHYGEKIELLPKLNWADQHKLLVIPQMRKSTKRMYSRIDLEKCGSHTNQTKKMLASIKANSTEHVFENLHNDFENFAGAGFAEIKEKLLENGAEHVVLCGSGTAVFALSNNPFDSEALCQALPNQHILNLTQ